MTHPRQAGDDPHHVVFILQQARKLAREHNVFSAHRCAREMAVSTEFSSLSNEDIAQVVCDAYKMASYIEDGIIAELATLRRDKDGQS